MWTIARWGNDPGDVCGKFLGWCSTQPQAMAFVDSLPGIPWSGFETDAEARDWYERLMAAAAGWNPPALMADVDGGPVTQAGRGRRTRRGTGPRRLIRHATHPASLRCK